MKPPETKADGTSNDRPAMKQPPRTLLITSGFEDKKPWWWDHVDHDLLGCQLDHRMILLENGRISSPASLRFIKFFFRIWSILLRARHQYQNILTFECGWESFIVSLIQTVTLSRRPRHVILQFIMREKTPSFASKAKYLFMRWCFSSVHLCICSSRAECRYYEQVFHWNSAKIHYVPLHTDPRLLDRDGSRNDGFILSAGRTYRDYGTLLDAFRRMDVPLVIVASRWNINPNDVPANVKVQYDLPGPELMQLMSRCMAVVLPLENRMISIGQSVLLQAMTLGKPVITTQVNGTADYIEHMKSGMFVPPNDPDAIQKAVLMLIEDEKLRSDLGRAAQDRIKQRYLPDHYARSVAMRLRSA